MSVLGPQYVVPELFGWRVFCRIDLNVPLASGAPADFTRIQAVVPTLKFLSERGAKTILATHLGYPKGAVVEQLRTEVLLPALRRLSGLPVKGVSAGDFDCIRDRTGRLAPGETLLLENLRFYPGEETDDPELASCYASLADIYINDAFSVCHRKHTSVHRIAGLLPAFVGPTLKQELDAIGNLTRMPPERRGALIGGNKTDKLKVIPALMRTSAVVCVGGVLGFALQGIPRPALAAAGLNIETAGPLLDAILGHRVAQSAELILPVDAVVSDPDGGQVRTVSTHAIAQDMRIHDIGEQSRQQMAAALREVGFVLWNGPLGAYESDRFLAGTAHVVHSILDCGIYVLCGGGDTLAACGRLGVMPQIGYGSMGGGALLAYLQGLPMPGLAALGLGNHRL
jgi:phosphoglycerate kinase